MTHHGMMTRQLFDAFCDNGPPRHYAFDTECPRCGRTGHIDSNTTDPPRVHCGDCLMNDVEIVTMLCTPKLEARQ